MTNLVSTGFLVTSFIGLNAFADVSIQRPRVTLRGYSDFTSSQGEGPNAKDVDSIDMKCSFHRSGQQLLAKIKRTADASQQFGVELVFVTDRNHTVKFEGSAPVTGDLSMSSSLPVWSPDQKSVYPCWDFIFRYGNKTLLIRGNIFYAPSGTITKQKDGYSIATTANLSYSDPKPPGKNGETGWNDYDEEFGDCTLKVDKSNH